MSKLSKEELETIAKEAAIRLFPYDTDVDKFTRDLRNGVIDLERQSYVIGVLDCYKMIQKGIF